MVTEHVYTFAEHLLSVQVECMKCGAPVRMVKVNEAAAMSRFNLETFQKDVEAKGFHFTEDENGALFICLNSLLK